MYGIFQVYALPELDTARMLPNSEETSDAKGLQQGFERQDHLVLAATNYVRQDLSRPVIDGRPQSSWFFLFAHEAPPFLDLRFVYPLNAHGHGVGVQGADQGDIYRCEGWPFFSTPESLWPC